VQGEFGPTDPNVQGGSNQLFLDPRFNPQSPTDGFHGVLGYAAHTSTGSGSNINANPGSPIGEFTTTAHSTVYELTTTGNSFATDPTANLFGINGAQPYLAVNR
ncbi:MAG: hypothetical protein ACREGI_02525, partial [Candidatus Levyibacteriota bacterium]